MKSLFTCASMALLLASGAAFAAQQAPSHPLATNAAAAPATAAKADRHAAKHHGKTALAPCKTTKGADKSACKSGSVAKASGATTHPKARKHA